MADAVTLEQPRVRVKAWFALAGALLLGVAAAIVGAAS